MHDISVVAQLLVSN